MGQNRSNKNFNQMKVTTLGGGCFWCTEAVFSTIKGVEKLIPGYAGGKAANPTYEQVSTGTTGHAEAIQITYDPNTISFEEILAVFFATHDPTTINRQGADVGTQYRSVIFYHTDKQKTTAMKFIEQLNNAKEFNDPIMTQVEPFTTFYEAEKYHKNYYKRHPEQPYCKLTIAPKIAKLRQYIEQTVRDKVLPQKRAHESI